MRAALVLALPVCSLFVATAGATEVPFEARRVIDDQVSNPRTAIVADVDGDGDGDIIAAILADNDFVWYENDGSPLPTFTKRVLAPNARGAREVWADDINGDGRMDILGAARADNAVYWYRNEGGSPATFTEFVIADDVLSSWSVYAADIDGDGDLDVTSAGRDDDRISWHENGGGDSPTWTKHVIDTNARRAQKAFADDVDGDGDVDMLSASGAGDEIAWYENDGAEDPSFTKHSLTTSANNAKWVWTADLDRDGDVDILAAAETEATIEWFENDGGADPSFTRRTIDTLLGAKACLPHDFDLDGDLDVLANGIGLDEIVIFENLGGSPLQWERRTLSTESDNPLTAFPGNIDGDGHADVVCASFADNTIGWYRNAFVHFQPSFDAPSEISSLPSEYESFEDVDLNDDGTVDLVLTSVGSGAVSWLERSAGGATTLHGVATLTSPVATTTVDFDRDGDLDVIVADANGEIVLCASDGGATPSFSVSTLASGLGDLSGIGSGDVDRDGDIDLFSTATDGTVRMHRNIGGDPVSFFALRLDGMATGARSPVVRDFNRDGLLDVAVAVESLDSVVVYYNEGGSFLGQAALDTVLGAGELVAANADGDSEVDLYAAGDDGVSSVSVLLNNAPDAFSGPTLPAPAVTALDACDVNTDGLDDAVVYSPSDNDFRFGLNTDGARPFLTLPSLQSALSGVVDVALIDLDHDGAKDIVALVADGGDSGVHWLRNTPFQAHTASSSISRGKVVSGEIEGVLQTTLFHDGVPTDTEAALARLRVRFGDGDSDPLNAAQAQELFDRALVYVDSNGSGSLEPGDDELVLETGLSGVSGSGEIVFELDTENPALGASAGSPVTHFFALDVAFGALASEVDAFEVTVEAPEAGDILHVASGLPLVIGDSAPATTPVIVIAPPNPTDLLSDAPWIRHTIDVSLFGAEGPYPADFDGDGRDDYTVGWEQSGRALLYLHPGDGDVREAWPSVDIGSAPSVESSIPVDLDGDGVTEVVSALSFVPSTFRVHYTPLDPEELLNPAAWSTADFDQVPDGEEWILVIPADIDNANGIDLLVASIGRPGLDGYIGWLRSPDDPGDRLDTTAWTYHTLARTKRPLSLFPVDVDHDGDTDVMYTNRIGAQPLRGAFWLENPGVGSPDFLSEWDAVEIGSLRSEANVADITFRDGRPEIAVPVRPRVLDVHTATDDSGQNWSSQTLEWPAIMGIAKAVRYADLDADGDLDFIVTTVDAVEEQQFVGVAWLRNPGDEPDGEWEPFNISGPEGVKFDIVQLADVDNDGDLDIVASEERNNSNTEHGLGVFWYENPMIKLTGDANRDRVTNSFDLAEVLSQWGPAGFLNDSDLNFDGEVDSFDLAIILSQWGKQWGPQPGE